MSFLDCVEEHFDHSVTGCREEGQRYKINLRNLGAHLIVKGDKILEADKSCDCIIFVPAGKCVRVVVVELKGKPSDVRDFVVKFRNTCQLTKRMIEKCNKGGHTIEFFPILYHNGIGGMQKRELRKENNKITFGKQKYHIILKEYKSPLTEVLSRFRAGN